MLYWIVEDRRSGS